MTFCSGPKCTRLLTTIVSIKQFNRGNCNSTLEFKYFVLSLVSDILEREIDTLSSSKDSQCDMQSFAPEHIGGFAPKLLDSAHCHGTLRVIFGEGGSSINRQSGLLFSKGTRDLELAGDSG